LADVSKHKLPCINTQNAFGLGGASQTGANGSVLKEDDGAINVEEKRTNAKLLYFKF
jgi:hypothetical protein